MNFIIWIVVGLIAGAIAKAIMPGGKDEPNGLLGTIILGIVGAFVGGFLSSLFFNGQGANGLNIPSIIVSVIGACVLIGILRLIKR